MILLHLAGPIRAGSDGSRLASLVFALLIGLYPRRFRREFGGEMRRVFADELTARAASGPGGALSFWLRTPVVTAWCAIAEHLASLRDRVVLSSDPDRDAARRERYEAFRRQLVRDVRGAIEGVEQRPVLSATIAAIAGGVAAFALAAGGVAHAGLFKLPFPDSHRLVRVETAYPSFGYESFPLSPTEFSTVATKARSFESVGALTTGTVTFQGDRGASRERFVWASPGAFEVLGLERPEIPDGASPRPIYVTHEFWKTRLSASQNAVGRVFSIDGKEMRVAGILPRRFRFWEAEATIFFSSPLAPDASQEASHTLGVIARLNPGVSVAQAQEEATNLASGWFPWPGGRHEVHSLHPLRVRALDSALRGESGPPFLLLLLAAAGLLILALLHLTILGWGGGLTRRPVSLVIERAGLIGAGGVVGVTLAALSLRYWSLAQLGPFGSGPAFGMADTISFFAISLVAAFLLAIGLVRFSRPARMGPVLVVVDIVASIGLLFGVGLLAQSVAALEQVDPGFDRSGLVAFETAVPVDAETNLDPGLHMAELAAAIPGVEQVALTSSLPITPGLLPSDVHARSDDPGDVPLARTFIHIVSPGYTDVLSIPLVDGRRLAGGLEAVVSETLARRLWPTGGAVGSVLTTQLDAMVEREFTVVGIVGDVAQQSLVAGEQAQLYVSRHVLADTESALRRVFSVVLKTTDIDRLAASIPADFSLGDVAVPISRPVSLDARSRSAIAELRLILTLLAVGAFLCLTLSGLTASLQKGSWQQSPGSLPVVLLFGVACALPAVLVVRGALDPLLFKAGSADHSADPLIILLLCWLAVVLHSRREARRR